MRLDPRAAHRAWNVEHVASALAAKTKRPRAGAASAGEQACGADGSAPPAAAGSSVRAKVLSAFAALSPTGATGPAYRLPVFGECSAVSSKFAPLPSLRPATSLPVLAEGAPLSPGASILIVQNPWLSLMLDGLKSLAGSAATSRRASASTSRSRARDGSSSAPSSSSRATGRSGPPSERRARPITA